MTDLVTNIELNIQQIVDEMHEYLRRFVAPPEKVVYLVILIMLTYINTTLPQLATNSLYGRQSKACRSRNQSEFEISKVM